MAAWRKPQEPAGWQHPRRCAVTGCGLDAPYIIRDEDGKPELKRDGTPYRSCDEHLDRFH